MQSAKSQADKALFNSLISKNKPNIERIQLLKSNIKEFDFIECDNLKHLWICSSLLKSIKVPSKLESIILWSYNINKSLGDNLNTVEYEIINTFIKVNYKSVISLMKYREEVKLDISENYNLKYLNLIIPGIKNLDLKNNIHLNVLKITAISLKNIDLSANKELSELYLDSGIESIDISQNKNLMKIFLKSHYLDKINLTNNINLMCIILDLNKLQNINLSNNKKVNNVFVKSNIIEDIDLSNNTCLTILTIVSPIKKLDLSSNPNLIHLVICSKELDILDLSKHKYIKELKIDCPKMNTLILNNKIKDNNLKIYSSPNLNTYYVN